MSVLHGVPPKLWGGLSDSQKNIIEGGWSLFHLRIGESPHGEDLPK